MEIIELGGEPDRDVLSNPNEGTPFLLEIIQIWRGGGEGRPGYPCLYFFECRVKCSLIRKESY